MLGESSGDMHQEEKTAVIVRTDLALIVIDSTWNLRPCPLEISYETMRVGT